MVYKSSLFNVKNKFPDKKKRIRATLGDLASHIQFLDQSIILQRDSGKIT